MKKVRLFTLLAMAAFAATGCTIYHPQAVDIPLINHAGDTRVDASFSMSTFILPDNFSLNVTASHGFNDWFAGQAHVNYGGDSYYAQLAPGAYYPLGAKSVLEGYVGLGFGGAARGDNSSDYSENSSNNYSFSGHYLLPFAQANIGWHDLTFAHFDLALGLKCGAFLPDYEYYEVNGSGDEIAGTRQTYTTTNFLFEPQAMVRFGGEHLKFNVRFGLAFLNDINSSSNKFIYDYATYSAGLTFSF